MLPLDLDRLTTHWNGPRGAYDWQGAARRLRGATLSLLTRSITVADLEKKQLKREFPLAWQARRGRVRSRKHQAITKIPNMIFSYSP